MRNATATSSKYIASNYMDQLLVASRLTS